MGAFPIVLLPPALDQYFRFQQRCEDLPVNESLPQLANDLLCLVRFPAHTKTPFPSEHLDIGRADGTIGWDGWHYDSRRVTIGSTVVVVSDVKNRRRGASSKNAAYLVLPVGSVRKVLEALESSWTCRASIIHEGGLHE